MLFKNDLFYLNGILMRLLEVDGVSNHAWIIDTGNDLAFPEKCNYSDIKDIERAPQPMGTSNAPSQARIRRCDKAWARLNPLLLASGLDLFEPSARKYAIDEHAKTVCCSPVTLYKDLRHYWKRGQNKLSLLPDYQNSGRPAAVARDDEQDGAAGEVEIKQHHVVVCTTAGRGRKTKDGHPIYQVTTEDERHFRNVIKAEYLKDARITIADTYQTLTEDYYSHQDGNLKKYINPPGQLPSKRQFYRFVNKNYNIEVVLRGRIGDSDYERDHRKVLGTVMADCEGVGHYYEIDATICDVYLVSSVNTSHIIGKATLYLIIDRWSRLIVGFYFGLENASWNAALQAILSVSEDKRTLCERYGVPYNPEDWPAHEVMCKEFLSDRGPEWVSHASNNIAEGLQSTVTNLPPGRPDWKPLAECGFKMLHQTIHTEAPAYDPPSNATKRQGKHYERDACLNPIQFGNLILNAIISSNRREILNYDLSNQQVLDGVRPDPISLWNHNIATRAGQLTRYEEKTVRLALLRKDKAAVTEHGVEFRKCFYSFPEAIAGKWFERARKARFRVTVSYDQRLVDAIYVYPPDGRGEPLVATLTDRSKKHSGLSFEEVHFYEARRDALRRESKHSHLQNKMEFNERVAPAVKEAKDALNASGKKSRHWRRADTKVTRETERQKERKAVAAIETGSTSTPALAEKTTSAATQPTASSAIEQRLAAARARMRA